MNIFYKITKISNKYNLTYIEATFFIIGFMSLGLTLTTLVTWGDLTTKAKNTALFFLPINIGFTSIFWSLGLYHWKTRSIKVRNIIRRVLIAIVCSFHISITQRSLDDPSLLTNASIVMFFILALLLRKNRILISSLYFLASWGATLFGATLHRNVDLIVLPFLGQIAILALFGMVLQHLTAERVALAEARGKIELEQQLRAKAEELAIMRERSRISQEIHDGLGHCLTSINAQAGMLTSGGNEHSIAQRIQDLSKEGLLDLRRSVAALHGSGAGRNLLADKLRGLVEQLSSTSLTVRLDIEVDQGVFEAEIEHAICRTVQEALTNVQKHAQASNVRISLSQDKTMLALSIADDGMGANIVNTDGYGLFGIAERVKRLHGTYEIKTGLGAGFKLLVTLPAEGDPA